MEPQPNVRRLGQSEFELDLGTAFSQLDKNISEERGPSSAIKTDGVNCFDVRQDSSTDWSISSSSQTRPEEATVRNVYNNLLAEYSDELDESPYEATEQLYYQMTDSTFADRIYSPPQYLHVSLEGLRFSKDQTLQIIRSLPDFSGEDIETIYVEDTPIDKALPSLKEDNFFDIEWSIDNILLRELTREFDSGRPEGTHVIRNLPLSLDTEEADDEWLFLKIMGDDSSRGCYPVFVIAGTSIEPQISISLRLSQWIQEIRH